MPTEPAQQNFIGEVTGYVGGHWRKTFRTLGELGTLLKNALREAAPMIASSNASGGAEERLEAAFSASLPRGDHFTWLHIAWTTLRNQEVVDPLLLNKADYQRKMQEFAHTGSSPLFSYDQAKTISGSTSRLRIVQGDTDDWRAADNVVVVDIYENGTLSIAMNVANSGSRSGGMDDYAASRYITPDQVASHLDRAWTFAARWWEDQDPHLRHASLEFNAALRSIGLHQFGTPPPQRGNSHSFTFPGQNTPDPLWANERPRRIGRQNVSSSRSEIDRIVELFRLRYEGAQTQH